MDNCLEILTGLLKNLIKTGQDVPAFMVQQEKRVMDHIGYGISDEKKVAST